MLSLQEQFTPAEIQRWIAAASAAGGHARPAALVREKHRGKAVPWLVLLGAIQDAVTINGGGFVDCPRRLTLEAE